MGRVEIACMVLGAALLVAGVAVMYWPVALCVAGMLLIAASLPRGVS